MQEIGGSGSVVKRAATGGWSTVADLERSWSPGKSGRLVTTERGTEYNCQRAGYR